MENKQLSMSKCESMNNIGYDILYAIAEFMDDIDIRRKYNIYRKIKMENYEKLWIGYENMKAIPITEYFYVPPNTENYYYKIKNKYEFERREEEGIRNDHMTLTIRGEPETDKIMKWLTIYRMKPVSSLVRIDEETGETERKAKRTAGYTCGNLVDYFWEYTVFEY
jgi:hypothetical protein